MTTASSPAVAGFVFDNSYARDLEGGYAPWQAAHVPKPVLVKLNTELATELGLDADALAGALGAALFSGNQVPEGATPLAQAYAGHQFGGFSPQLGDGRALLLGEVLDRAGQRRDIAFKGSGRTPFSRGGDGKAALGPILREYLMGEAMHALGIPTTRALAVVTTGESVRRDSGALPGAVLTRVAASHIRVGTFQFFAANQDEALLRRLADHVIKRHDPSLQGQPNPYLGLLQAVSERQAALIARWMAVGFIHGVMNTDNMTVSGETIDYGPCAFMDHYDPATVFSSIDRKGRYAYAQQPLIARWNLARLAETLLPLIHDDPQTAVDSVMPIIDGFPARYEQYWLREMRAKLGLEGEEDGDLALAHDFLGTMQGQGVDFTLAFRALALAAQGQPERLQALYADASGVNAWLPRWQERVGQSALTPMARAQAMNAVNPAYIPRNHWVEESLEAAGQGDLAPFDALLAVLEHPFTERPEFKRYAQPATPEAAAGYRTFCGT